MFINRVSFRAPIAGRVALATSVLASVAALAACSGGSSLSGGSASSRVPFVPQSVARGESPSCTPTVWASSLGTNSVYGFTASNTAPCITLNGPYNGLSFNAPFGLATDYAGNLYVADLNNFRIVVFTNTGVFVKALSTALNSQNYQPLSVCVSPKGIVGVGNREYNNSGPPGNVEFFPPNAPNNSAPTGWATGVVSSEGYCAFDERSNFFVDGTATTGGQKIAYLPSNRVDHANQTLSDSLLGTGSYWMGMYSRINSPANDTLSVAAAVGSSNHEVVKNFKITGPPNGPLSFTAMAPYNLTSYPPSIDAIYQLAPALGGSTGTQYIADYGSSVVLSAGDHPSGPPDPVAFYNSVSGTVGVATDPTGQY